MEALYSAHTAIVSGSPWLKTETKLHTSVMHIRLETICITSYPKSEITKASDLAIEIYSDEVDYPMEAISSRIAHLSVIDVLTIALSARDYEAATERARQTHTLINTIRY